MSILIHFDFNSLQYWIIYQKGPVPSRYKTCKKNIHWNWLAKIYFLHCSLKQKRFLSWIFLSMFITRICFAQFCGQIDFKCKNNKSYWEYARIINFYFTERPSNWTQSSFICIAYAGHHCSIRIGSHCLIDWTYL